MLRRLWSRSTPSSKCRSFLGCMQSHQSMVNRTSPLQDGGIDSARVSSQRIRDLGFRIGYARPPTIHDFRAEGLHLIGKSLGLSSFPTLRSVTCVLTSSTRPPRGCNMVVTPAMTRMAISTRRGTQEQTVKTAISKTSRALSSMIGSVP